jgi:hypothetical protein
VNSLVRGIAIGLFAVVAQLGDATQASPALLVTIDVESSESLSLPAQVDAACESSVPCGPMQIAKILNSRGFAGSFFLNVYEYKAWGEDRLRSIAVQLQNAGQDVALHTHPQWIYDAKRPYMYSYSADDQNRIIADGVRLLRSWTGQPVVAHRAGAYSANMDTIAALANNGILLDSSLFFGHPESKLNGLGLPNNLPAKIGDVIEIPVTVYKRHERPALFGSIAPPFIAIGKVDVNSIQSEIEARAAMDALVDANPPVIVVFLHSFSLIDPPRNAKDPLRTNALAMSNFSALLDEASKRQLRGTTARELVANRVGLVANGRRDLIPEVKFTVPLLKYLVRILRSQGAKTPLRIGIVTVASAIALSLALLVIRRRRLPRSVLNR